MVFLQWNNSKRLAARAEDGHDEDGLTLGEPFIYDIPHRPLDETGILDLEEEENDYVPEDVIYAKTDERVDHISNFSFQNRSLLKRIDFSSSVRTIGVKAFEGCNRLKTIKFPPDLQIVQAGAFAASGLTRVEFPDSLTMILSMAFYDCKSLEYITLPKNAFPFVAAANLGIFEGHFAGCTNLKHVAIPKGVESIPPGCFYACESLTEIVFPSTVVNVGQDAFHGCHSLMSIRFSEGTRTQTPWRAFSCCPSIYQIKTPESWLNTFCRCCNPQVILIRHINLVNNFHNAPIDCDTGIREFRNQDSIDLVLWPRILDSSKEDLIWHENKDPRSAKTSVRTQKTVVYSLIRKNIDKLLHEQSIRRSRRVRKRHIRMVHDCEQS